MKPETDFAGRQVAGSRDEQQDDYGFCPLAAGTDGLDGLLLVLADGMGAYAGGGLASRLVVQEFIEMFCYARGPLPQRLLSSLRASERRLHEEIARQDERLARMGSTLIAAVWTKGRLHWISVGDSGLFLYRGGKVRRLNADHSMVPFIEAQVARGDLTSAEAARHPDRHALRSALGDQPVDLLDLPENSFEAKAGDIFFAASDGLASIEGDVLAGKLDVNSEKSAQEIASALLIAVNEARNKKQDNATVAVVKI